VGARAGPPVAAFMAGLKLAWAEAGGASRCAVLFPGRSRCGAERRDLVASPLNCRLNK